ncbi:hypothetical protein PY546_09795 [Providencia stuartii]|nr:hypothetical protein [Providencia stuartii]
MKSITNSIKIALLKKVIFDIQVHLQKIEGYFKDARLAVDHLDYMWLVILTEIKQSIETFARIDNAANLLKFIARFKKNYHRMGVCANLLRTTH